MKKLLSILLAVIMITACSVGYAKDSPPKNASFETSVISTVQPIAIVAPQMNVIANEVVTTYSTANAAEKAISDVSAITAKVITLPAPKARRLSKYNHYNLITDYWIKKVEARARSSDIYNQNRRC